MGNRCNQGLTYVGLQSDDLKRQEGYQKWKREWHKHGRKNTKVEQLIEEQNNKFVPYKETKLSRKHSTKH